MTTHSAIFLETSIQIMRCIRPEHECLLLYNLINKQLITSCYVLSEFRRTLLSDLAFLKSVIKDYWLCQEADTMYLHELLDVISAVRTVRSARRYQRFMKFASCLLECFGGEPVLTSDVLEWLDEHIEDYEEQFFLVDYVIPQGHAQEVKCLCPCDCDLGNDDQDLNRMTCRREEASCSLSSFLQTHKEQLHIIYDAISRAPSAKRSTRTLHVLERVLDGFDLEMVKGQRNCWPLGDVIIALGAPQGVAIYTLDGHFDVICAALGKKRYTEIRPSDVWCAERGLTGV